jgi:nicotinamidase/pyrazinamidase
MNIDDLRHRERIVLEPGDALIVVDMQNDFMPGGALPVAEGDTIVEGVNAFMKLFSEASLPIVLTQDWHPSGHRSFASAHAGKNPFDLHEEPGIGPVLWPDHCIQSSIGSDFPRDLDMRCGQAIIRKGYRTLVDSYSGFLENDKKTWTGLNGYVRDRGVKRIFVCGLALDYCVFFTASDGADLGYEVVFLTDLSKPVGSPPDSVSRALGSLTNKGVWFAKAGVVER